ncbi:MAG TPA: hypothetical protein ACFYD2_08470 [Candidatus Avalokitesvara rifleensis]
MYSVTRIVRLEYQEDCKGGLSPAFQKLATDGIKYELQGKVGR